MIKVTDFTEEFIDALTTQLNKDQERWGNTWLKRTRAGQEERILGDILDYYDQYKNAGVPIPWLKIIGNCLIAWIRENHSEMWEK